MKRLRLSHNTELVQLGYRWWTAGTAEGVPQEEVAENLKEQMEGLCSFIFNVKVITLLVIVGSKNLEIYAQNRKNTQI